MAIKDYQNFHQMLKETVDLRADAPAYAWFTGPTELASITWRTHYDNLKKVAKSLIALGVEQDNKVNVLSNSRYEWVVSDHAVMSIGAVTVGIYQSNLPRDCGYIINHSDAVLIFVENQDQLNKLLEIRSQIPNIRKVVIYEGPAPSGDDWCITYEQFLKLGEPVSEETFEARTRVAGPGDVAGIVYTSGTTGVPKGAMLTHDNFCFTTQSARQSLEVRETDRTFLFLPLAHVFARIIVNACASGGVLTVFSRGMDTLIEDIKVAAPDWFASVPRIYEKVYSKVFSGVEARGGVALKIFRWALDVGYRVSDCKVAKKPVPALLGWRYALANKLVFHKIQAALGGRLRWCISGAAPLNADIARFFHAAGVLILEGIGMTENTSFSHVNRVDNYRFGWVGLPGPGIEAKIAEDGELLTRGRNTMKGYYKMPEETAAVITPEGWLKTGDLGEIDSEGFLRITGRKKDLIITAGGKNVAPAYIEGVIATSKYIHQVCVIGDGRKYLTALVTLDPENVQAYAKEKGIPFTSMDDLIRHPDIQKLIENEVEERNRGFARYETIKKVTIVPEFTVDNGLLTPTLKLKKNVIIKKYAPVIDSMYPKS